MELALTVLLWVVVALGVFLLASLGCGVYISYRSTRLAGKLLKYDPDWDKTWVPTWVTDDDDDNADDDDEVDSSTTSK